MLDEVERGDIQSLGDSNYLLVELPSVDVPKHTDDLICELKVAGLRPILAHPERNAVLVANPD